MSEADQRKWDREYAKKGPDRRPVPAWLASVEERLPTQGRALDLASGHGRIAHWLADRGLEVTALDISPVGLAQIEHPRITTVEQDLEADPGLPPGPFDLVTVFFYRQPSLGPAIRDVLAPGGLLVAMHPTVMNLERHARPPERFLAEPGELHRLADGLDVLVYEEGWRDGFHTARLIAARSTR